MKVRILILAICLVAGFPVAAQEYLNNLLYARDGGSQLLLDLYLPADMEGNPPLLIWIHGGNWRAGDKDGFPTSLLRNSYAMASIDFRNSTELKFPAQIHDIKAAVRFLRANAWRFGYDPDRIALWGYSTGGHLALLTGIAEDAVLEGEVGEYLDTSSRVQAVVAIAAQTNLLTILDQSTGPSYEETHQAMRDLFGKDVVNPDPAMVEWLRLASPVLHVTPVAPPVMIMHGLQDLQVPPTQSLELQLAYEKTGVPFEAAWVEEADHFTGEFFAPELTARMRAFLDSVFAGVEPQP